MNPHLIFVGYRLKKAAGINFPVPDFQPSQSCKHDDAKAKNVAEQKAKYEAGQAGMPYTGTFDEVHIRMPGLEVEPKTYKSEGRGPGSKKPSIGSAVAALLMKYYGLKRDDKGEIVDPGVWSNDLFPSKGEPRAIFVGFEPRTFLKVLGIECSLPLYSAPRLPLGLWYGNSDHRDIGEAVLPTGDCKLLDFSTVVVARKAGLAGEDLKAYDEVFDKWEGPGHDPQRDVEAAMLWAVQLGFTIPLPEKK